MLGNSGSWIFWYPTSIVSGFQNFQLHFFWVCKVEQLDFFQIFLCFFGCIAKCNSWLSSGDGSFHEKPNGEKLICFLMFLLLILRLIICWLYDAIYFHSFWILDGSCPPRLRCVDPATKHGYVELQKLLQEDAVDSLNCCFKLPNLYDHIPAKHKSTKGLHETL